MRRPAPAHPAGSVPKTGQRGMMLVTVTGTVVVVVMLGTRDGMVEGTRDGTVVRDRDGTREVVLLGTSDGMVVRDRDGTRDVAGVVVGRVVTGVVV